MWQRVTKFVPQLTWRTHPYILYPVQVNMSTLWHLVGKADHFYHEERDKNGDANLQAPSPVAKVRLTPVTPITEYESWSWWIPNIDPAGFEIEHYRFFSQDARVLYFVLHCFVLFYSKASLLQKETHRETLNLPSVWYIILYRYLPDSLWDRLASIILLSVFG